MKGIIIYQGKYGATEQYARWLGEELGFRVLNAKDIQGDTLNLYDIIILGSSVYIGKLQIAKWCKKNFSFIKNKRIFLYQVAGAPTLEVKKREDFNRQSLTTEILESCKVYYFAGRLRIGKLSWYDRFMLKMGARMTKDPVEKKSMLTDYDLVKRENTRELVSDLNSIIKAEHTKRAEEEQPLSCSISTNL
ncbi:MAG TPA: flavodoxin domain-containing protein [Chitinophagaceae bacterium]|nr:flavodoxin domain-containing protein [Chitinophagaceae bacterium]